MPINGFPTYQPQPQFSYSRAYIEQIVFGFGVGALFTQSDERFFITDGTNPLVHVVCNFFDRFWTWSGNAYSLDHMVVDWWLLLDPSPTPLPLNFTLRYRVDPVSFKPQLFIFIPGWTTEYAFDLPPAPSTWWRNNP